MAERLPDRIFDRADQVEVVDIEPADLLERLKEGKIYRPNQAARAMDHFFTLKNLAALREIALRRTADRLNRAADTGVGTKAKSSEHILVCLSGAPSNANVIRTAARMAEAFRSSFTALFVETDDPSGPFGNKALGEPPTIPVAPAIRNAVLQATGVAVNTLPLSPQKLVEEFTRGGLI